MFGCIYADNLSGDDRELMLDLAGAFSPLIEETSPGTLVLDFEGSDRLFGSPGNVVRILDKRISGLGITANTALAQNPDTAIHAARGLPGITVIPAGKESERLSPLSLALLSPALAGIEEERASDIIRTLELWGIHTFGDFAVLPEIGIAERLGPDGVTLQRLARGASSRPLRLIKPPTIFEKSMKLEYPVELIQPLLFILSRLLDRLCVSLTARGLAANELRLSLGLEDRSVHERRVTLPFPMRDPKTFLKLLQFDIESHPPQGCVIDVSIAAEPMKPRVIQHGLFLPLSPEPQKLELTVARIAKLVGPDNVGSAELIDTHRPGAFRVKRFEASKRPSGSKRIPQKRLLGFRVVRPPAPLKVEAWKGRPVRVRATGKRARNIAGKVVQAAGPWRASGEWWTEDHWARDEWDVTINFSNVTGIYRIYRDLRSDSWFLDGAYD